MGFWWRVWAWMLDDSRPTSRAARRRKETRRMMAGCVALACMCAGQARGLQPCAISVSSGEIDGTGASAWLDNRNPNFQVCTLFDLVVTRPQSQGLIAIEGVADNNGSPGNSPVPLVAISGDNPGAIVRTVRHLTGLPSGGSAWVRVRTINISGGNEVEFTVSASNPTPLPPLFAPRTGWYNAICDTICLSQLDTVPLLLVPAQGPGTIAYPVMGSGVALSSITAPFPGGAGVANVGYVNSGGPQPWQVSIGADMSTLSFVRLVEDTHFSYNVMVNAPLVATSAGGPLNAVGQLATAVVNAGGAGYAMGDTVGVAGGTGGVLTVNSVGAMGVVTDATLFADGTGYTGTAGAATTAITGTGAGLTVNTTVAALGGGTVVFTGQYYVLPCNLASCN